MSTMNQPTRREALRQTAGICAGLFAGNHLVSSGAIAGPSLSLAPSDGVLKKRFKTRTINVHSHLWAGRGPLAAFFTWPYSGDPKADPTPREKEMALAYFNRYKHGPMTFDSPQQEATYIRKFVDSRRNPLRPGTFEENAQRYLKELDAAGIDTAVLLLLEFAGPPMRNGPVSPSTERAEELMAACAETCKKHPGRFVPFAGIDVRRGKAGVPLLEKAVKEYGFKGCGEIVTTLWQTPPDDRPHCYPYYEKCQELNIPVMIDATMDAGFTVPHMYETVARDFPKLKICLGGAGMRVAPVEHNGKKLAAYDRILQLAETYENIWLDLDDWQVVDKAGAQRFFTYLRRALDGPARSRIMFGSDYPIFAWMVTEKEWIEFILDNANQAGIRFSDDELALFFSKNALRYLSIE